MWRCQVSWDSPQRQTIVFWTHYSVTGCLTITSTKLALRHHATPAPHLSERGPPPRSSPNCRSAPTPTSHSAIGLSQRLLGSWTASVSDIPPRLASTNGVVGRPDTCTLVRLGPVARGRCSPRNHVLLSIHSSTTWSNSSGISSIGLWPAFSKRWKVQSGIVDVTSSQR